MQSSRGAFQDGSAANCVLCYKEAIPEKEQHMKPEDMTDKQLEQLEDGETSEEVAELGDDQLDGIAGGKRARRRKPRKRVTPSPEEVDDDED